MIEIRELYKYYGDRRAVGPLSASIQAGEIVGLLGLNGSGKTTTLRVLACDLLPTSGTVSVGGLDVVERPDEVRGRIGYLPDTPPLYGDMTVGEFLDFAARLRGVARSDVQTRVRHVEELTELGPEHDQIIASLSHGYKQRVGIAQAIVHRPELVVLDEPISGLDPVQIVEMRELVRNLGGEHTVIISSHILSEISETCDRILVIRDGEIVAGGTEAELSARLGRGHGVELTVRLSGATGEAVAERARSVVLGVSGVTEALSVDPSEAGEGVATLSVRSESDVRDQLCRALVGAGIGILEVGRREGELESVFLELSGESRRGRGRRAASAADGGTEAEPAPAASGEEAS